MNISAPLESTEGSHRPGRPTAGLSWRVLTCASAVLVLGACSGQKATRDVAISYDQVANFSSYHANPSDPPVSTPGAIFVMYRITKIENNGSAAQPFTFGQHKVVTSSPIRFSKDPSNNEEPDTAAQLLGDKLVENMQVPSGKVAKTPGCFIKTVRSNNANTLASTLVGLSYEGDSQAGQTVKMRREPSNNVTSAVTQATAVSLRSLC